MRNLSWQPSAYSCSETDANAFPESDPKQLVNAIALRILQSHDLETILKRTVEEVRQYLHCDRVVIYRFEPDWSGVMVVESVIAPWKAVLGQKIKDPCFSEQLIERYQEGRIQAIADIRTAGLSPCHFDLLAGLEVRANLVVPIIAEQALWGLLIAQQCSRERQWQSAEIDLLKGLATQVGIAIAQAELHQQIQCLNAYLELRVKERTAQLQQSLTFETLIREITEKVRDSLDESQILQTVTQKLGEVLHCNRCKIELYNADHTQATIVYEYTENLPTCQGTARAIAEFPEIYQPLLQKQSVQFVEREPYLSTKQPQATRLACPIFDGEGILGNLWLFRPVGQIFADFEVCLIQQVAAQCAIAIRQARLYQASQVQVRELEKLNALKDNFLKTISHELRTPMSSILLGAQTLEQLLQKVQIPAKTSSTLAKVFQIFYQACQQQNKSVDDLLTFCYIDAERAMLIPEWFDLNEWIERTVQPFRERTAQQNQCLTVEVDSDIPLIKCDIATLERIFSELLNNACKYTPSGETIAISAKLAQGKVLLGVTNSGTEIATEEIPRIFEKFYRIPNNDPWKCGGTGLGLALVQKLAELIGASVEVESQHAQTTFTVVLPME